MGAEPDTQYKLTGFKEFNSPEQCMAYVNYVLEGLDRGSTKIGAGIGTWGNTAYVQSYVASTGLDFIALHVYPIVGQASMDRILTIAETAKRYGKSVVLDEAWLYKVDSLQATDIAANTEIFRRDAFSFWEPLDKQFLASIAKSARLAGIEYISPFWTTFFFSYINYDPATAQLPYNEISAMVNKAATRNMMARKFSSTGEFYGELVGTQYSTTRTTSTAIDATSALTIQKTDNGLGVRGYQATLILLGTTMAVVVTVVILARWHQHQKTRRNASAYDHVRLAEGAQRTEHST
jgi:hypothetical protein